jgi:hypothetical protein
MTDIVQVKLHDYLPKSGDNWRKMASAASVADSRIPIIAAIEIFPTSRDMFDSGLWAGPFGGLLRPLREGFAGAHGSQN